MRVIRLVFTNPMDPLDVVKKKISWNTLFEQDFYIEEFSVFGEDKVKVVFDNDLLTIKTELVVDVVVSIAAAPVSGIYVKTKGSCIIYGVMDLDLGLCVLASDIELDAAIVSQGFVGLNTSSNPAGKISFKHRVTVNKIGIITNELINDAHVSANQGLIVCKTFTSEIFSRFSIGEIVEFKETLQDVSNDSAYKWDMLVKEQQSNKIAKDIRHVSVENIINRGALKLLDVELHIDGNITHSDNGKTTYNNVRIFSNGNVQVCKHEIIEGNDTFDGNDRFMSLLDYAKKAFHWISEKFTTFMYRFFTPTTKISVEQSIYNSCLNGDYNILSSILNGKYKPEIYYPSMMSNYLLSFFPSLEHRYFKDKRMKYVHNFMHENIGLCLDYALRSNNPNIINMVSSSLTLNQMMACLKRSVQGNKHDVIKFLLLKISSIDPDKDMSDVINKLDPIYYDPMPTKSPIIFSEMPHKSVPIEEQDDIVADIRNLYPSRTITPTNHL